MNQPTDTEDFYVLARIHPVTGNIEYCVKGGYYWTSKICDARQYSKPGSVKSLAKYDKDNYDDTINLLNDPKTSNYLKDHYSRITPPKPYEYKLVKATKQISLDWAGATAL